ncbi:unnamed protein product [marine sediment metagenome]|uniref:SpoVT-AbrB domain-containing protein n=1 Tax=marine sediment metagenome TaxID=412755 RepID=X1T4G8_9ZZZZ
MEKIVTFDTQGRLYFPEEMRRYLQFKTLVARIMEKGILLEPIEDSPLDALARLGKGKLKGKTIKQLKKEARKEIEDATKKIR